MKYSVKDIDKLKKTHEHKYIWGTYNSPDMTTLDLVTSRSYSNSAMYAYVSFATDISMKAGHTAEDLLASEI